LQRRFQNLLNNVAQYHDGIARRHDHLDAGEGD
jgi:hypothetical protein